MILLPLQVSVQFHARVWGGQRLKPTTKPEIPIGEAWLIHELNTVQSGVFAGRSLKALALEFGSDLLGTNYKASRFPLLIKLLDCADWLSIQVHPNDLQAVQLEGVGQLGKTEAWHLLEVDAGAKLIAGVKNGISQVVLETAIRSGNVQDVAQFEAVQSGDTVMMHAGTMHALGPGMLLYEVQQTSDITYRVYDWDRPASAGRALHLEQSVAVTTTSAAKAQHEPVFSSGAVVLTTCPYFVLEKLKNTTKAVPDGSSFHTITLTKGSAMLECAGMTMQLQPYDSIIIPATSPAYSLQGNFEALRSSVPAA